MCSVLFNALYQFKSLCEGMADRSLQPLAVLDAAPGSHVPRPKDGKPLPAAVPSLAVLDAALGSHVQLPAVASPPLIGGQTPHHIAGG
jgi:hypothetical protein